MSINIATSRNSPYKFQFRLGIAALLFSIPFSAQAQTSTNEISACMKPLLAIQQDKVEKLNFDDQRSLMVYRAWQTEFKSVKEAKNKGIDLDIVYAALELEGSYEEKEKKYLEQKNELSISYFSAQSRVRINTLVTHLTNVDAVKTVANVVAECLKTISEASGRYCAVTDTDNTVTVALTAKYLPRMPRAKITSARAILTANDKKRTKQLFKKGDFINPAGIMKTIDRQPYESVAIEINTTNGIFACRMVAAWPKYVVSGRIFGTNLVSATNTNEVPLPTIPHTQCLNYVINWSGPACAPEGATIKTIQLSPNTPLNPLSRPGVRLQGMQCARPAIVNYTLQPNALHCANVHYVVRECYGGAFNMYGEYEACLHDIKHGTAVIAAVTYEKTESALIPEMKFTDREINGNSIDLSYEHAPSLSGQVSLDYEVTISDLRNKTSVQLSRTTPSSAGFATAIDPSNSKLIISTPN